MLSPDLAALADEQRAGVRLATWARLGALAIMASFTVLGRELLESGSVRDLTAVLLDPDYVSLEIWMQQVIIALVVAGILAVAVWRSRAPIWRATSRPAGPSSWRARPSRSARCASSR